MIEAKALTKIFGSPNGDIVAVDDATMRIRPGEFVLILGRSGSGKSTLLGMLAGLIRPTQGTVSVNGQEVADLSDDKIAGLRAREIGFVFQFSGLIPTITTLENVLVPTLFCRQGGDKYQRALALLGKVGLAGRRDAYPETLSSGEMKRAAIARALMNNPSLLIADEPTGDLDIDTEIEVMDLFRDLNREGMTIIMVTHNPDLVRYATRTYSMDHGRLTEGVRQSCACPERPEVTGTGDTGTR